MATAFAIGITGDSVNATASHARSAALNSSIRLASPTSATAEMIAKATNPIRITTPSDRSDTRRSWASLGSSTPAASAHAFLRSSRSQSCSPIACRVWRSTAAGCSSGSTCWRASVPSAASAADAARCGPTASAVVTRTPARSAAMSSAAAATAAPPKSPNAGSPVGPDHHPGGIQPVMGDPDGVEPPKVSPDAFQELVVDLVGIERAEWVATGLGHQQRVALGGHPGRHHREHRDPGPLGQQGDEGLVLDLLAATQRQVGGVAPVPQRGPGRRRAAGRPRRLGRRPSPAASARLAPRRRRSPPRGAPAAPGVAQSLHAQLGQGVGDLAEGEAARRGAEQQVDDGG